MISVGDKDGLIYKLMIAEKIAFKIQLLIVLAFFSLRLNATEYQISSAGELDALSLSPGDTVIMAKGVWENQQLKFEGVGTESEPITLMAEEGGEVLLTGNSKLSMGGEYLVVEGLLFKEGSITSDAVINFRTSSSDEAFHCRLTNTKIIDYNPANKDTEYKWVSIYGQYNRVDHCHFEGKTHNGATLVVWRPNNDPDYHQIDSNYFGPRPDLGYNGGETIRVGTSDNSLSASYTVVESNVFEECDGEIEIISNKSCKNIYRNNTFRNSEGSLTLRHGNACEIYNNFFFGTSSKDCGGIRIIGEDHKVYNNHLQDIPGDGYRAAISIVNGVPDSPLNRYFQVLNAEVVNNTIVDCRHPIVIGAGADSEKSLPPKDCEISNNVVAVYSSSTIEIIEYEDEPLNMTYQNNIMFGASLGIPDQTGIEIVDPELSFAADNLWRPEASSPVISYGVDTFSYVTFDMDGQSRVSTNDAGSDQLSADKITNTPLDKSDVGVSWVGPVKEVSATQGGDLLKEYIESALDDNVIILTTSGGIYEMDSSSVLSADISIIAQQGLAERPIIKALGEVDEFIKIEEGGKLQLIGIEFDGGGSSGDAFSNAIQTSFEPDQNYISSLIVDDCIFHDFTHPSGGNILQVADGIAFEELRISNTQIYEVLKVIWSFETGSFATIVDVENCTFRNIGREVLFMNVSLQDEASVAINHCTIDSVGHEGASFSVFSFDKVASNITNNLFTFCGTGQAAFEIMGTSSVLDYCLFWETGLAIASDNASIGSNISTDSDPLYIDRENYQYSFLPGSQALYSASDGENLGDLFWSNFYQWSDNAYLSIIYVDNESIDGFKPSVFDYISPVVNPDTYTVSGTTQHAGASLVITYPASLPGICNMEVTAEDKINKNIYTVDLHEIGANALLADLLVDSISIEGFEPELFTYNAKVKDPESYTVHAITQDPFASYKFINASSIPGTAYIQVTAENETEENIYSVKLDVSTNSITNISNDVSFIISPNPCENMLYINTDISGNVGVFNQLGQLTKSFNVVAVENTIAIDELPAGCYFIIFKSRSTMKSQKIIVN